ncbi:MAG: GDSL-type esterase/lipase family protein [Myxococcota bacterium]
MTAPARRSGGRRRAAKLLLIPFGLLLGLVLLEAALQMAAWGVRASRGPEPPPRQPGDRVRVLCIGDSNTYGLYLEPHESYPGQLETLWTERVGTPGLEVLNLGYPGTNSSRLVRDLPQLLDRLAPDVVILMVGVNDYWTQPFPLEGESAETASGFLKRHSKLYRAYRLLRGEREGSRFERDPRPIPREGPKRMRVAGLDLDVAYTRASSDVVETSRSLERNLQRLIETARSRGVEILLMSYPARHNFYKLANGLLRRAPALAEAPLVDLTGLFEPLCPERECPDLLFHDGHPKAAGYRLIAETLVEELRPRYAR